MTTFRDSVIHALRQIRTVSELEVFCSELDLGDHFSSALRDRIIRWLKCPQRIGVSEFDAGIFVSADLSTIMLGDCPTIFLGSNEWAVRRRLSQADLEEKLSYFRYRVRYLSENYPRRLCFVVVPEKDVVVDKIAGLKHLTHNIDTAVTSIEGEAKANDCVFVYDNFLRSLPPWTSVDEYRYADSHLLGRDYLLIFREILAGLGIAADSIRTCDLVAERFYGDLNEKFAVTLESDQFYLLPKIAGVQAELVGGVETFAKPLGATVQIFKTTAAPINAKVAIYGDSHSSVFAQRRLTYLFAQNFSETEFRWIPWGGAPEDFNSDADIVVMEIAQRFLFT